MVDTLALGASTRKGMEVQVLSSALVVTCSELTYTTQTHARIQLDIVRFCFAIQYHCFFEHQNQFWSPQPKAT